MIGGGVIRSGGDGGLGERDKARQMQGSNILFISLVEDCFFICCFYVYHYCFACLMFFKTLFINIIIYVFIFI